MLIRSELIGWGHYLPKKVMTNDDLAKIVETNDEWISTRTGIKTRHIVEDETTADLAYHAAQMALDRAGIKAEDLDLIIVSSVTPDNTTPSVATKIAGRLGTKSGMPAFDILAACSGFVYGLVQADNMIRLGQVKTALVIGAESLSKIVDWTDRSTCVLFGDGAGAVLLENTACDVKEKGLGSVILGSDGTGGGALYINQFRHIEMNGRTVYNFAVRTITETITALMEKESLQIDDVDLIVCHQANSRILEAAASRLNLNPEKVVNNIEQYGNTSAASIPITLADLSAQGRLRDGMVIIMAGFGAGLTWGGCVIRW